jgi:hypothetical protein
MIRRMHLNKNRSQPQDGKSDGTSKSGQATNQHVTPVKRGNPNVPCKTCARTFHTQNAANDHMRAAGHERIPCKICARTFQTPSAANDHMRATGHDTLKFSCKECARRFSTKRAANKHMTTAGHGNPSVSCWTCAKKFHTQSAADDHMRAKKHGDLTKTSHTHGFSDKMWSSTGKGSHTHGFSDKMWSSTGKGSDIITDATDHTTQDSAFETSNEARKTSSPEFPLTRTVYAPSATSTTPARGDKGYIGELAEHLFGVVNRPGLTQNALDRVSRSLPDLLRTFAVQVGYRAPSSMHCDVMFYVRKDRV